jgi:putative FmdB family regulatory protein
MQKIPQRHSALLQVNNAVGAIVAKNGSGAGRSPSIRSGCLRFEADAAGVYNSPIHFSPGGAMPHYEFFCHDCKKLFSKILSFVDYERDEVMCPKCGSKNVEQRWSAFSVITSKKSA